MYRVKTYIATIKFSRLFPVSRVIADQYLFIFIKLEEDNISLFYNPPFGQTRRYFLTSLATVKLVLIHLDKFIAIDFNEFNDNDNSVLFHF